MKIVALMAASVLALTLLGCSTAPSIVSGPGEASPTELTSTYGDGTGWTDREFRHAVLEFEAEGVSRLAPYNRFRITQEYRYEEGRLLETVELFKTDRDGQEIPFARIEEEARMFYPR